MPSMTVPTAAMRRLRRERDAGLMRGAALLAPAGGISKKPVVVADLKKNPSSSSPVRFCAGAKVRVRTPTRLLRPGRYLVFWLHAVVVDAGEEEEDDGHVGVIYCGNYEHPESDAMGVVRVPRKDVKNMVQRAAASDSTTGSSDVTTSHSAGELRRPTVGGKTPSVLKKIEEAMRLESEDSLDSSW